MDLNLVPDRQLLAIYDQIVKELLRRQEIKRENSGDNLKNQLKTFEEKYPGIVFHHHGSAQTPAECRALRKQSLLDAPSVRLKYLKAILMQDWSHLWLGCDPARKYYVYAHVDPLANHICLPKDIGGMAKMPFYIGKGTGSRAFDLSRNQGHGIKLSNLRNLGFKPDKIVSFFKKGLTEAEAFELESKLVYFFGTQYEHARQGILLNLDECKRPIFKGVMNDLAPGAKRRKSQIKRLSLEGAHAAP